MTGAAKSRFSDEARETGLVPLDSILCTERLTERARRPPDYETESRMLGVLNEALAESPHRILQTTAEQMLEVFQCDSAGFSLLTNDETSFYWPAVAGEWQPHIGDSAPREFGPCGDVLDHDAPLLFCHWERRYRYLLAVAPPAEEALVVPLRVDGKAIGTIWTLAHDERRKFDAEDLRLLESLSRFASAAHRTVIHLDWRAQRRAALNLMEDAVDARRAAERLNADLREKERRLTTELAATRALHAASTHMVRRGDEDALCDAILDAAVTIMGSDCASLQMLHPERGPAGELRLLGHRGFSPQAARFWEWVRPASESPCGAALRTKQRVMVSDVRECEWMAGSEDAANCAQTGVRAVQSTPLVSRSGDLLGMVSTQWHEPHKPSERAIQLLDVLARQAADLLDRNLAEDLIRRSEAKYRTIFESAAVSLWEVDFSAVDAALEGLRTEGVTDFRGYFQAHPEFVQQALGLIRVVDVNDTTVQLFGARDKSELLGALPQIFTPESLSVFVEELVLVAVAEGRTTMRGEALLKTLPGRPVTVLFTMTLASAAKKYDRVLFSLVDISERSRLELETREQAAALAKQDRRKDEFLAMLSHELRNPLASIASAVRLLGLEPEGKSRTGRRALAIIERQVDQLTRLVNDLLEVSRITTGRLDLRCETVTLTEIVQEAAETVRPIIERGRHKLSVSLPSEPVWVHADAARLEQVVVNLLSNSAKFTDDGGQIGLTLQREGEAAVLRVKDSGVGIEPEFLPHVFDLFTQAERSFDRSQGGLGLGLSLVQRLVKLHGGTVKAESVAEQGSEFVVRLPVIAAPSSTSAFIEPVQAYGKPRRVLVVDDNVDSAEALAMLLEAAHHDVRTAHDGLSAFETILDYRPDIVLLDIGMPELNGYEIAARIRQLPEVKHIVLVAVTGYGQEADRQRSRAAGLDHHLVKPVDFDMLLRIIASGE